MKPNLDLGSNLFRSTRLQACIALGLAAQLGFGWAASPAIGVVVARGAFDLDSSKVTGNGTLFDGSTIETGKATSELKMLSGVRLLLDSGTRTRVYQDHVVLERGTGQIQNGGSYTIKARSLQISPASNGMAKVSLLGQNRILVAALGGPVRVANAAGVLVAEMATGGALEMEAQESGAAAPSTLTGCLVKKNGRYFLTDETAGVTVELQGPGLDKEVGNHIQVTGARDPSTSPAAGASQLIRASTVKHLGKRCTSKGTAAAAAGGAASAGTAAGTAAGTSAGTAAGTAVGVAVATKVIIAGVVIAGATAGTAVGLTRDDRPSISQ